MEPQTIEQPQTTEQPHTVVEPQSMEPQYIVPASQLVARGRQPAEPSTLAKQADLPMIFQDLPGDSLRGFNLGFEFQDPLQDHVIDCEELGHACSNSPNGLAINHRQAL